MKFCRTRWSSLFNCRAVIQERYELRFLTINAGRLIALGSKEAPVNAAEELPLEISCPSVKMMLDEEKDFFLLDCRRQDEFDFVHLAGAELYPIETIESKASELEILRDRHVVVVCHAGMRSMMVTQWLRKQGFARVQSMAGGMDAWATTVDPTVPRY